MVTVRFTCAALLAVAAVTLMLSAVRTPAAGKDAAHRQAERVALAVKSKAERLERKERGHSLVDDTVAVTTGGDGEPVIEQRGEASFYGEGFHGKTTAAGDRFDRHGLTAAHPSLPLGSEATVTNLENGSSVEVRINDRGPHALGRDIDLSEGAARVIGLDREGSVPVRIEAELPPAAASR
jgi:rare lipoprotein A (peptidoglycan hydrolase)